MSRHAEAQKNYREAVKLIKFWRNLPKLYRDCWRIISEDLPKMRD